MMCHCRFSSCNKNYTVAENVGGNGGNSASVREEDLWEISVRPPYSFALDLKLLKK